MFQKFLMTWLVAGALSVAQAVAQPAYWVIESNVHSKDKTIVKVYNLVEQLLAEKEIQGRVDIARKKDRKMLNKFVKATLKEQQALIARRSRKSVRG